MKLRAKIDNRGVSEIIGAILVFGLVVLSLVVFQTNAVPSANEEVEFDHNQEVQSDLLGLDAELSDAAASGNGGTAVVTVGTDYPTRFLFRNPPPVSGTLTTETSRFSIENAAAVGDGETDDYWNGDGRPYESRQLVYRVDYNVYEGAPTTVLSHGVVYDVFGDGTTRRIDAGGFIDGRSIELTALAGRRNESRVGDVSVPVTAQSAPTETVRVRDDPAVPDDNITLTVRTEATAAEWEGFLEDEMTDGYVARVDPGTAGSVEVVLEEGTTYQLELARVAVGSAPYDADPAYVTADGPTDRSVVAGTPTDLTVDVRDEYNGPVAGEDVTFTIDDGDGATTTETVTTDGEGRATLSYTPSESVTVTATVDGGTGADGDPLSVVYDLTASPGPGGGPDDRPGSINRGDIGVYYTDAETGSGNNRDQMTVTFRSRDDTYTMREARISFIGADTDVTGARVFSTDANGNPLQNIVDEPPGEDDVLTVTDDFSPIRSGVTIQQGAANQETFVFDFDAPLRGGQSRQEFFVLSVVFEDSDGDLRTQTFFVGETP
jgi:hypothetical protein